MFSAGKLMTNNLNSKALLLKSMHIDILLENMNQIRLKHALLKNEYQLYF